MRSIQIIQIQIFLGGAKQHINLITTFINDNFIVLKLINKLVLVNNEHYRFNTIQFQVFKDEKMTAAAKKNQWLLCDENNVIWVIGKRLDRRYAAHDSSNILQIKII